jgi:hypothetical protein
MKYKNIDELIAIMPSITLIDKIETANGCVYQLRSAKVNNFSIQTFEPNSINQLKQNAYRVYLHPADPIRAKSGKLWPTGYNESIVWRSNLRLDQVADVLDRGFV